MSFPSVDPRPDFPALERAMLDRWDAEKVFERSITERPADKEWSFYDGPPFATGLPHYGHLLAGTMKDLIPRFWTMRGFRVRRVWGWDCHGLPVEYEIEKQLQLSGKQDIEAMGVTAFNDACRATVLRYTVEWQQTVRRMGRWVDMDAAYRTMDPDFMESVWWVFRQLYDKDLLYKGHKAMHLCPRCATPLSNFEVAQNYKDVTDPSVVVAFPLREEPEVSVLAWTTTPWTLPGNVLLAVNSAIVYVEVLTDGKRFILAKDRVESYFPKAEIVREVPIAELVGQVYEPLFPFYADTANAFRVVAADFVTAEDGTGVVHIAPAFGDDDYQLGRREELPFVQHVTTSGVFTPETDWLAGKEARPSNRDIIRRLQEDGRMVKEIPLHHSYPHCWRCDTPLLNYANASWFVKVEHLRNRMVETNEQVNWVPHHLKHGRFGKWLENARDWNISRNRYWGTPLPVWECPCGERRVVGSRDELARHSGGAVTVGTDGRFLFEGAELDLHSHVVDRITLDCSSASCSGRMRRIPEVLDCWFESGSMPYAQRHYPFDNKDEVERTYPADFIAEGLDQTRGWFYTLHVLATALEITGAPAPAFRNVIVNGLVLAEDGQKMSKSKKNYPDPMVVIEQYGADAVRFALMASPAVRSEDLRFSEKLVGEVVKTVHLPIWNTLSFFTTYANLADFAGAALPARLDHELDRWIVAATEQLTTEVTAAYEGYDLQGATRPVADYLDGLTNWYVRRSRGRFASAAAAGDRTQAMATLGWVLERLALLLAPVTPFLAELVWERLGKDGSVHLQSWPEADAAGLDPVLVERVATARGIVRLGLSVRAKAKLPVRQPLAAATVGLPSSLDAADFASFAETLAEELNVLELRFEAPEAIATQTLSPDPRVLGKRLGGKVQEVLRAAKAGDYELQPCGDAVVAGETLKPDEYTLGFAGAAGAAVESEGGVVVALDTTVTPELAKQGALRQLARAVNDARKAAGLQVGEPAALTVSSPVEVDAELRARLSLASVAVGAVAEDAPSVEVDGTMVRIVVIRSL